MEDVIVKYQKQKKVRNISIVITSLCLALALNIMISTNNISFNSVLKGSVIEANQAQDKADLYLEQMENDGEYILSIKASKNMENVKNLSFSLAYNYDNVEIDSKYSDLKGAEILNLSNTNGFNTVLINFEKPVTITNSDNILNIVLSKKTESSENLNIVTSNFTDTNENIFMLSSQGVQF